MAKKTRVEDIDTSFIINSFRDGNRLQASVLAWRIPWTEEPGGLQSIGSHRVGHN